MIRPHGFFAIVIVAGGLVARGNAVELQRTTVDAWQEYVRRAAARMNARLGGGQPFLWIDEAADRASRLQRGEILVGRWPDTARSP